MLAETLLNTLIIYAFVLVSAVQLLYYIFFYLRICFPAKERSKKSPSPVSVIICARNEASNLKSFLPSVLEQDYPDFEVIVVNDCSEDDTDDVLKEFTRIYKNLRTTVIHKDSSLRHSKKMALFLGIKSAINEHLLLTDADCQPVSDKWISTMCSRFSKKTDFILGYGGYLKEKGILNRYIRYDAMFIAMQYLGMAGAGVPYMGVGRNLAYKRSLFFSNRGFGNHLNLQSGDDDLFVNSLARKGNTRVVLGKDSFTRSLPSLSWSAFSKQKKRHTSTSGHYRFISQFLLGFEPVSRTLFYLFSVILITGNILLSATLPVFSLLIILKLFTYLCVQKSLKENDLLLFSLLFDIAWPFISAYFLFSSRRNKNQRYEWK